MISSREIRSVSPALLLVQAGMFLLLLSSQPVLSQSRTSQDREFTVHAEVTLGDSRKVSGTIRLRAPETLTVRHAADGLQYEKTVRLTEIKTVEIIRWKGVFIREIPPGRIFDFFPSEYTVVLQDGFRMLITDEIFYFLKQVTLENEKGKIVLFTYWRDLRSSDGKWFTGTESPDTERTAPYRDAVRSFTFRMGSAGDHE